MTTGQEKRKTIPKPNPNLNLVSMIWAATRSNMSRYGAIPTRKAAPLIKRKNLPTFCTVVSGFWFTSAICTNQNINIGLSVRVHGVHAATKIPDAATRVNATPRSEHDRHRDGGDDDAGNAAVRFLVADQRGTGFVQNIERQGNKARSDDSQGGPLNLLTPGCVQIVVEPPQQRSPGRDFDEAVEAEADQGNGTGDDSGENRDQPFETVVAGGEVFEFLAPTNKIVPSWNDSIHQIPN
jgi:hypothetical protein